MNRLALLKTLLDLLLAAPGPWLIAVGLALVALAQLFPYSPVLFGVAMLMLGSTLAVRERVPPQLRLLAMSVNLLVYLALYGMFLGAVIHMSAGDLPTWLRLSDMGGSAWIVVASLQLGLREMQSVA